MTCFYAEVKLQETGNKNTANYAGNNALHTLVMLFLSDNTIIRECTE